LSSLAVSWFQTREARKTELRSTLIAFGSVVYRIDPVLRAEPESGKAVRFVNAQMSTRWPHFDHTIGLRRRRLLEPELAAFAVGINGAMTSASLLAPPERLPSMGALTELMSSAEGRDESWQQDWNRARTAYSLACPELLGSGVTRVESPA
jgi:hypothetical protein